MGDQVVEVRCYSGSTYAERPRALVWQGKDIKVTTCLSSQNTPYGSQFEVMLKNGWRVRLQYHLNEDYWTANSLPEEPKNLIKE